MEHFISSWGYVAIFVLTVAESACIPIPSEVTLGLGGALASGATLSGGIEHHPLNLVLVIVVGVAGEMVGSSISYAVGRTGGRAIVDRFGKYLLLTHKDLDRAEAWFAKRGDSAVLVGRVIPVVRTFISFPAGVAEMPVVAFGVFTFVGVTVWVSTLALIGWALGGKWNSMVKAFGDASYVAAALVAVVIVVSFVHRLRVVRVERAEHGASSRPGGGRPDDRPPADGVSETDNGLGREPKPANTGTSSADQS